VAEGGDLAGQQSERRYRSEGALRPGLDADTAAEIAWTCAVALFPRHLLLDGALDDSARLLDQLILTTGGGQGGGQGRAFLSDGGVWRPTVRESGVVTTPRTVALSAIRGATTQELSVNGFAYQGRSVLRDSAIGNLEGLDTAKQPLLGCGGWRLDTALGLPGRDWRAARRWLDLQDGPFDPQPWLELAAADVADRLVPCRWTAEGGARCWLIRSRS
jgi:hypothetical protein